MFEHDDIHEYCNHPPLLLGSRSYVDRASCFPTPYIEISKVWSIGSSDERLRVGWKLFLELILSRDVNSVSPIRLVSSLRPLSLFPLSRLLLFGFYDLEMASLNTW